jgi:very-short-patch-repair endonuclease
MRREIVIDRAIADVAGRQGGVVARRQLADLGLGPSAVDRRVRGGRLYVVHRGVYAVGHRAVNADGRRWAAVLACGDGAVLSHASAASAWDLRRSASNLIDVTVGPGGRGRRTGIRPHRRIAVATDEVTQCEGLPITTPARTLLDLAAGGLRGRRLEAAVDRAELLRLVDFGQLRALVRRHAGRPGVPALQAVLEGYDAPAPATRSVLEELILELCEEHTLPRPVTNSIVEGRERDFVWPSARLVVEADSYAWHRSPSAMTEDRERDAVLILAGYRVLRFTWEQVTARPDGVARTLRRALDDESTSLFDVKSSTG